MPDFTTQQSLVALIVSLALVLFVSNWLRFDLVGVVILVLLVVPGLFGEEYRLLTNAQALHGFSNEAIIILACLFVIARALQKTGLSDWVASRLKQVTAGRERGLFGILLALVGLLSAFVNNTAVTAMSVPVVLRSYTRLGHNPNRVYLPLAYISLVGGTMTLIGTTTNIIVSSVLAENGMQTIGMFEMFPAGVLFTVISGVFLFFVSPFFFKTKAARGQSLFGKYNVKEFLSEILVKPDSRIVGTPLQDLHYGHDYDITIIGLVRDGRNLFSPPPTLTIRENDVLMVQGGVENIISIRKEQKLELVNEMRVEQGTLRSLDLIMAEIVLLPNSSFIGLSIRDIDLRDHYGVTILALSRRGLKRMENLADIPLRMGDTLLIQGHPTGVERLQRNPELLVLETFDRPLIPRRLPIAVGILGALAVVSTFQHEILFLNFVLAVLALLVTRCVTLQDVYTSIDWRIIVLIATLIPLGTAFEESRLLGQLTPFLPLHDRDMLLALIFLVTLGLTQIISNTVAAALMTPVAIDLAGQMAVDPRPLIMAVAFAASFAFVTPIGHQACTLVMGPGNYRASDYLKLGGLLSIVLFIVAMWIIPEFFPFVPV